MEMITLCVLCIVGVLFYTYFYEHNRLFAHGIALFLTVVVLIIVFGKLKDLLLVVDVIKDIAGVDETYITLLLKMTGIIFLAEFTADICEEQGCKTLGKQVLLSGRLAILLVGYPVLLQFVEMMRKFLT